MSEKKHAKRKAQKQIDKARRKHNPSYTRTKAKEEGKARRKRK